MNISHQLTILRRGFSAEVTFWDESGAGSGVVSKEYTIYTLEGNNKGLLCKRKGLGSLPVELTDMQSFMDPSNPQQSEIDLLVMCVPHWRSEDEVIVRLGCGIVSLWSDMYSEEDIDKYCRKTLKQLED